MILLNYRSFKIHVVNSGIYSELFRFRTFFSYTWLAHFSASSRDTQQTASSRLAPPSNFLIPSLTQVGGKPRTKQLTTKADESYDALLSTPTDAQFDIRSISSSRVKFYHAVSVLPPGCRLSDTGSDPRASCIRALRIST